MTPKHHHFNIHYQHSYSNSICMSWATLWDACAVSQGKLESEGLSINKLTEMAQNLPSSFGCGLLCQLVPRCPELSPQVYLRSKRSLVLQIGELSLHTRCDQHFLTTNLPLFPHARKSLCPSILGQTAVFFPKVHLLSWFLLQLIIIELSHTNTV